MTDRPCRITGPYLPVGDTDWECRTHGVETLPRDPDALWARQVAGDSPRRSDFRCPVGEPRPGDDVVLARPSWVTEPSAATPSPTGRSEARGDKAPRGGRWDEPATARQIAHIEWMADGDKEVPPDLATAVADARARGLTKGDAYALIPRLHACPTRLSSRRGGRAEPEPPVETEAERAAREEAEREFSFQMYEANGEEYPGQMEEDFGRQWLEARRARSYRP